MGLAEVGKELKRNEVDFMHCLDINPENKTIILLIHPMLSSAEGMRQCIVEGLKGQYRPRKLSFCKRRSQESTTNIER